MSVQRIRMAVDATKFLAHPLQSRRLTRLKIVPDMWCPPPAPVRVAEAEPVSPRPAATPRAAAGMASFHTHPRALIKLFRTSSPPE